MDKPIPSLLLIQVIKCLLNWTVVLSQWRHMGRSFLGTFCVSLALADTLLALALSTIYGLQDFHLLGLRFTQHHICLLIQIACFTYGLLHWPLFLLAGMDHYWTLQLCPHLLHWFRRLAYALGVCVVWTLALLYVFLGSGFYPNLEEDVHILLHQCRVASSPQSSQVSAVLLLVLGCTFLYCYLELRTAASPGRAPVSRTAQTGRSLSRYVLCLKVKLFLSTWAPFVVFQAAVLFLRVEIPAYLDMNIPWLCFLNSFLVAMVSWNCFQEESLRKIPVSADGFCDWDFSFGSVEVNSELA
ncbi:probable G-protein coupled receptor 160 [Conger conger]|uniref:probable G-protein coupled receptor 160 n=1 Tax=Conger conger TaxID=82655 RepID=UPI002A5ABA2E|nr:probable G-protein coupled receptor 160 [Conger conger]